ncbi:MAG TPA: phenylalanine--tRNA ligase subunit beta [Actinomycetaceae bacterium]|nr:phenylalanine--tRNA ligase subunit beta [Actinomycetaceae bacterium]
MPYVPIEWLREHVDVPADLDATKLAADLVKVGLEPEQIVPAKVTGDLVVGHVVSLERLNHKNKTISYARVDVGELNDAPGTGAEAAPVPSRGVICGAPNLEQGQNVLVALPGTVLPGGFEISARKTYGHISDGMICSELELGLGEDHTGIIVLDEFLPEGEIPPVGTSMLRRLGLGTELLEINVTPDRGYCYSMRGVAREYSHSTGNAFRDPVAFIRPAPATDAGFPVTVQDERPLHGNVGCDRFVTRVVRGVDPAAPSPDWMKRRLTEAGMRPISLAVDITNYVMLDLGQPLHAYDLAKMREGVVVRRARPGERLTTLDDVDRALDPEDLLITDDGGDRVLGFAGVMGGASTEIDADTTDVLIEAAHFDPSTVARSSRRHRLPSEAAKRFERGVDPELAPVAAQRVVDFLVEYGGGVADPEGTDLNTTAAPAPFRMDGMLPARHVGVDYTVEQVVETMEEIGCRVQRDGDQLTVIAPTWRPDLVQGVDIVEEVARLRGYDQIPSVVPPAPAGRGLTPDQRRRRAIMRALAEHGLNEVLSYPFAGDIYEKLDVPADDPRRIMMRLANPIADDQPYMRSTLLATLVDAARRNVGRGNALAVVESGMVTKRPESHGPSPLPPLAKLPSDDDLAAIHASVPAQPWHVAAVAAGPLAPGGALGDARAVDWGDAIELARMVGRTVGVDLVPAPATLAPWHPGRCAELRAGDAVVGHAGELHPRALEALDLPQRSVAFELDLDAIFAAVPEDQHQVTPVSTFPAAKEDIALVMAASTPAARALDVVRRAAGELAEDVRLFDDYRSESLGADLKSLAFALRLRAPDRTLSAEEIAGVRETVLAAAADELNARLR